MIPIKDFDKSIFFHEISNEYSLREESDKQYNYIFRYLEKIGCKRFLVESDYIDRDYMDDYSNYYVSCYRMYNKKCKRLHFFKELDEEKFNRIIRGELVVEDNFKSLRDSYLGFMVVKPLPLTIIGRTVLKTYENTISSGEDKPGSRSIRTLRCYHSNLFGIDLELESLAFQEQDTVVAACATSAIWSALQKACDLWGYYIPTPFEITSFSTRYEHTNRPIPSTGLTLSQMAHGIKEVGLEPQVFECIDFNDRSLKLPLLSICYSYLRAGVPVILCVDIEETGGHAITLTGYKLSDRDNMNEFGIVEPSLRSLNLTGSRIITLYGHDDQIGPFSKIGLKSDSEKKMIDLVTDWTFEDGRRKRATPLNIIIPIYHKIRISILSILKNYVYGMDLFLKSINIFKNNTKFEWDIYLTDINQFKSDIIHSEDVINKEKILTMPHPRFFWRIIGTYDGIKLFEFLADSTDMERSFQFFNLIFYNQDLREIFKNLFIEDNRKDISSYIDNHLYDFIYKFMEE